LKNTVYIKLTATIIDPVTYLPTGCKEEYIDSIVVNRPIAAFTDDGHEFPCPDNTAGAKGRTIQFTSQAQGELGNNAILRWNFGDTASGDNIEIIGRATDPTLITPIHKYNNAGVYDVLFIVQDDNTCTDSIWKKDHVVILGPRGDVSNTEDSSNCKPLQVTFVPLVEQDQEFRPDSIAIHVGTGDVLVNSGDYFGLIRPRRHVYQNAGVYLPVYFFYKTVQFSGRDETCIVQVVAEDSIYVIDLEPNFQTEPLYCPEIPITFNNTSTWKPSYLGDTSVTMSWNMGNGDTSQNYHGETQYDTGGIYPVTLTAQVLRCIRPKVIDIEVMDIPQVSLIPDTAAACDGLEVIFTADSLSDIDKGRILHYEWVFEDGTTMEGNPASREFIESGEYPYTLTLTFTPTGCSESYYDTVTIFAHKSPTAAFEANPKVGEVDQEFTFTDKSSPGDGDIVRWFWDFKDGNYSADSLTPIQTHAYSSTSGAILVTLFIKDEFGCQATTDVQITITEKLNLPNLFTPGGNCPNGKCGFRPIENKGYFKEFTMEIYDKWGVLVWRKKCTDPNCPDYEGDGFWWDGTNKQGKQVADGVYYWVIYALPLSETDPFIKNGSITVVNGQK
jgi:PKD repeat protein